MSAPAGSVFVHTVFDGRAFVPSNPVDLPVGTTLDGNAKPPISQEEWLAKLDRLEGAWGDLDFVDPHELPYEPEEPLV